MLIFLLLFFEIIMLFIAYFGCGKDLLAPSVVFCGMFVISTLFAALNVFAWNIDYSVEALLILTVGIFCFVFAELNVRFLKKIFPVRKVSCLSVMSPVHVQWFFIILCIAFNLAISFWYYKEITRIVGASGYFEGSLLHSFRVVNTNLTFATDDSLKLNPLLNQCLKIVTANSYVFLYAFIRNFWSSKTKGQQKYLLLLVAITALIPSILTGGRGGILRFLSAALAYSYIIWHQVQGWHVNISGKSIFKGISYFLMAIPIFYYSTFWIGRSIDLNLFEYISNYIGGSIQLFNLYVQMPTSDALSFGEESLTSLWAVFNKFSADVSTISLNLEPRALDIGVIGNVYTFFRRPLHDFGIGGMCIFTWLIGLFIGFIYEILIKERNHQKSVFSVLIYGYLFYWIILAPIDQWSQIVISLTNLMEIIFILLIYTVLTKIKVRL